MLALTATEKATGGLVSDAGLKTSYRCSRTYSACVCKWVSWSLLDSVMLMEVSSSGQLEHRTCCDQGSPKATRALAGHMPVGQAKAAAFS